MEDEGIYKTRLKGLVERSPLTAVSREGERVAVTWRGRATVLTLHELDSGKRRAISRDFGLIWKWSQPRAGRASPETARMGTTAGGTPHRQRDRAMSRPREEKFLSVAFRQVAGRT